MSEELMSDPCAGPECSWDLNPGILILGAAPRAGGNGNQDVGGWDFVKSDLSSTTRAGAG